MGCPVELIVHSAIGHLCQRQRGHVSIAVTSGASPLAENQADGESAGELRTPIQAALLRVESRCVGLHRLAQTALSRQSLSRNRLQSLAHAPSDLLGPCGDLLRFLAVGTLELFQQGQETLPAAAISVSGREVGPSEERFAVRRQPGRHWPATSPGQQLDRLHVDRVEIGTFFPIDLDRDVVSVEEGGDFLVLERFLLHHVAPVTGRIADAQQDRSPQATRGIEGFLAPGIPVHRIVGVLSQVRARLQQQPIAVARRSVIGQMTRARHVALSLGRQRLRQLFPQLGCRGGGTGKPPSDIVRRGRLLGGSDASCEAQQNQGGDDHTGPVPFVAHHGIHLSPVWAGSPDDPGSLPRPSRLDQKHMNRAAFTRI